MAFYEIWLDDPWGRRLALLERPFFFDALRIANNVAAASFTLPTDYDKYVRLDGFIEVWRDGKFFNIYLTRAWQLVYERNAPRTILKGQSALDLLKRRIIPYFANTAQTAKTMPADDMMKEIVRENLGSSATDVDRRLTSLLSIAPNQSKAPSITKRFPYRNVLEVLRDISDNSRQAGTRLYFDVVPLITPTGQLTFEFQTKTGQPGQDRSKEVLFGPEWGNLEAPRLTFDYREEATVVYAGGQGLEDERVVEKREDVARSNLSPWNRSEEFYNVSGQAETVAAVQAGGDARLSEMRPRVTFEGNLVSIPGVRLGVEWDQGDLVTIVYRGYQFPAVITGLDAHVTGEGAETIDVRYEIV